MTTNLTKKSTTNHNEKYKHHKHKLLENNPHEKLTHSIIIVCDVNLKD